MPVEVDFFTGTVIDGSDRPIFANNADAFIALKVLASSPTDSLELKLPKESLELSSRTRLAQNFYPVAASTTFQRTVSRSLLLRTLSSLTLFVDVLRRTASSFDMLCATADTLNFFESGFVPLECLHARCVSHV